MALRSVLAVAVLALGACSFVLDPDELRADGLASEETDASDVATEVVSDAADVAAETTPDGDVDPGKTIDIVHSGMISCTFEYHRDVTQCAAACAPGWTYVVDASASTGVGSFAWTFGATKGYTVEPDEAVGARVELRIGVPECLIGGVDMPNFDLLAQLSVDGGTPSPLQLLRILVTSVQSCDGEGSCPDP